MNKFVICCACLSSLAICAEKKAVIIGATSGMGKAVAIKLAQAGYVVGMAGRREHILEELKKQIPHSYIKKIDVTKSDAQEKLQELIGQLGGMDLMVISISSYSDFEASTPETEKEKAILDVDLLGFYAMARVGFEYFEKQNSGHMVGISSIDGIRGNACCPVYSGAKAFIDKYLEGKRNNYIQHNIPITVTDIIPGWVDNESCAFSKMPGTYWVASTEKAANQIVEAIESKKKVAYITKRWELISLLLKIVPDRVYNAIGGL
jgi:short-subunit dehydrogenase